MAEPIKMRSLILALILLVLPVEYSFAADKVVVIPFGEDAAPKSLVAYNQGGSASITSSSIAINSVELIVPTSGTIIANASVQLSESNGDETGCAITTSTNFDLNTANFWEPAVESLLNGTIAIIRHFPVSEGSHTIYVVCQVTGGTSSSSSKNQLSLLFVPD